MTQAAPKARSTVSWGVLDQLVSSGANFVFIIIAARALDPDGFGSVALGFEVYLFTLFAARGVAGETLMARYSGLSDDELRGPTRSAAGAAVAVGALVAVGTAVVALFFGASLRDTLLVVAVVLPVLVLQDFVRQALIAHGRARDTCMNDLLWAVLQLPMIWIALTIETSGRAVYAGWAVAGAIAAIVGLIQLRLGRTPSTGLRVWLRDHRTLWPYFLGDNLLYATSSFVVVVVISGVTGLAGLAAFRVAMTLYAPLATVGRGVIAVAVSLLARRRSEPEWIRRSALIISWTMAPMAFIWGAILVVLPDAVGEAAFGQSWDGAQPLVFLASFPCAVALFAIGASSGLRALEAGRAGLTARILVSVLGLIFAGLGGILDGVRGAFIGYALLAPLQVVIWSWLLRDATRSAVRAAETATEETVIEETVIEEIVEQPDDRRG